MLWYFHTTQHTHTNNPQSPRHPHILAEMPPPHETYACDSTDTRVATFGGKQQVLLSSP